MIRSAHYFKNKNQRTAADTIYTVDWKITQIVTDETVYTVQNDQDDV